MTWIREVGHVVRKDLRGSRWLLLPYVGVVAVATARGAGLALFAGSALGMTMIFVVVLGALCAASVVQADSPTRADAFWATHPFRRSAMLSAKVSYAVLLLALATAGQAVAVRSFDLGGPASVAPVLVPATFFGAALLGIMLVAGLTSDLRSFFVAAILIPLAAAIASMFGHDALGDVDVPVWLQLLGLVAGASLLAWLYMTRDGRRRTRIGGFALVASTLMTMCSATPTLETSPATPTLPHPPTVTLEPLERGMVRQPGRLQASLRVNGLEDGMRARVLMDGAAIRLPDGTTTNVSLGTTLFNFGTSWNDYAAAPSVAGVRWLDERRRVAERGSIDAELSAAQRRAMASSGAVVTVNGRLQVWESIPSEILPLVAGREVTKDGRRTRVVEWTPQNPTSMLVVDAASIERDEGDVLPLTPFEGSPALMLFNDSRREAVRLVPRQSSGPLDGLVLPGTPLRSARTHFALVPGPNAPELDEAWLGGARARLIRSRFRGTYPFALTLRSSELAAIASTPPR